MFTLSKGQEPLLVSGHDTIVSVSHVPASIVFAHFLTPEINVFAYGTTMRLEAHKKTWMVVSPSI